LFSYSRDENSRFIRITPEDGLSASWVRCIYQDEFGFIWFGTSDGLNRYDGYEIKVYKPDAKDPDAIVNAGINFIAEKENGKLWICTERGVDIFDREHNVFIDFPYLKNVRVTCLIKDHNGKIWFGSHSGLFRYDPKNNTMLNFIRIPGDSNSISGNSVEIVYEDSANNIWIGTQDGLNLFNPSDHSFKSYKHTDRPSSIGGDFVQSIIQDDKGRLWVGNLQSGLDLFVNANELPDIGIFKHVLPGSAGKLMIDSKNQLWIGHGLGTELQVLDLNSYGSDENLTLLHYDHIPYNERSLSDDAISALYEDRNGDIWIGTYARGVNYYSSRMKEFYSVEHIPGDPQSLSDNMINYFLEDGRYLWIATENGLDRLDRNTNTYKNYYYDPDNRYSLGANGVICIYRDSYDNMWVGTWNGGLNLYNRQKDNFRRYMPDGTSTSVSSVNVFAILQDSMDNLWIGTNGGGLDRYNYRTKKFVHYLPDRYDSSSIYHNAVNDICITSEGELYISTYHSLDLFDYETGTFSHYVYDEKDTNSITDGNLLDIFEDSKNNLWIATTRGLNYFNRKEEKFIHYTIEDGLPSNTVQAILEDDRGNLWLSTNNGISKFIRGTSLPSEPEFKNYFFSDGLQSNEFIRRSALKTSAGKMYFGGSNGYTYFHPDSIFKNSVLPEVVLIDFELFGVKNMKEELSIGKDINLVDEIILSYGQSDFTVKYAALNYLNPELNSYQFKLDGYEKDWHIVGSQRSATYTNIQHGKYTFMVRGTNNDGVWGLHPKELRIIITPPWYKTLFFKIIAIASLIALIIVIYRVRFAWLEKQKNLLEKMVRERTTELSEVNSLIEERQEEISLQNEELEKHRNHLEQLVQKRTEQLEEARKIAEASDKLKSAFLANMSHEIRTPMNAIVGFASMLKDKDMRAEEKEEFIDIIVSNSQSLLVLINDILEISLIEANQLTLSRDPFNAIKIFEELESYFKLKNKKKLKIIFNNKENRNELILFNDRTRFRQIISNLISNSYKYTETGKIEFGYEMINEEIRFYVADTGIGINEMEYQRIFDYFHKIDKGENKLYRGAGIGLSICNKLVDLMGGKIWLESAVGKGTTFYFTLPYSKYDKIAETTISEKQDKVKYDFKGATVLIAEDEPNNYKLLNRIIKATRANVFWAKNGEEAVKIVKENRNLKKFVVLMDIKMPVMNGITANEEIKKINRKIPVIAVTAYAQTRDKEEILKHDFADYIAKPFSSEKLLNAINKHIN
jgi:signal transduction histidine kinase/ligand-binding sensor domain-containing protein/ActR/RegA family two-component response regulator